MSRQDTVMIRAAAESRETPRRTSTGYIVTIKSMDRPEALGMNKSATAPTT